MARAYRGRNLDGDIIEVAVEGTRIISVTPAHDPDPPLIAPPLVDLQHNGALGFGNNRLHEKPEGLRHIASFVRRHGVGRMLFTTSTYPYDLVLETLKEFDRQVSADADLQRLYFGHFSEGIYISPEYGWRGGHQAQYMRDPVWDEWARMQDACGGRMKVINVDPSRPNAIPTIKQAVQHGLRVSMGHCGPSPQTIRAAVDAGVDLVTHFGNGAPPQVHRHHNPFWTWLAEPRLHLGLIADGHHLPPDVIRAALAAKGKQKIYLVSDASGDSGLPPGEYGDSVITPDGACRLEGQELLAGAWFQVDRGVERMCQLGWSLQDAWRQTSLIPAQIIGITLPQLAPGQPAEFVLARYANNQLKLQQVVALGQELLSGTVTPLTV